MAGVCLCWVLLVCWKATSPNEFNRLKQGSWNTQPMGQMRPAMAFRAARDVFLEFSNKHGLPQKFFQGQRRRFANRFQLAMLQYKWKFTKPFNVSTPQRKFSMKARASFASILKYMWSGAVGFTNLPKSVLSVICYNFCWISAYKSLPL